MKPLKPEEEDAQKASRTARNIWWRDILDHIKGSGGALVLYAIEFAALVGFLCIAYNYYGRLQSVDKKPSTPTPQNVLVAAATEIPTAMSSITPSSEPTDAPTGTGAAGQREAPIPSPSETAPPEPTETQTPLPGAAPPKRLVIPSIGVDAPVVQGDTKEDLRKGVGHRVGSANPGAQGNMVLSAHNDIYGKIFRDLQRLKPGAKVLVYTDDRAFHYVVQGVDIVPPTKVEFIEPTNDARLTMITCHPYLIDTHRVVAIARLAE